MQRISLFILGLLMMVTSAGNCQHWLPIPLEIGKEVRVIYLDTPNQKVYFAGEYAVTPNGGYAKVFCWDGNTVTELPPAPVNPATCFARFQDKLYIGGGGGIARLNGSSWERIDSASNIASFYLYQDKLVVAGGFSKLGGQLIKHIATFDGQNWESLYRVDTLLADSHTDGSEWGIGSVVAYKNELYVAGNFNPDKPAISEIARFDGQHWHDVGGGIVAGGLAGVSKLLVWEDTLYVAGEFQETAGGPGNTIAKWDGHSWHRLGRGIECANCGIYDMAVYHDKLYTVGVFHNAGNVRADWIARWDKQKWCSLGDSFNNVIVCLNTFNDELLLGGGFTTINTDSFSRFARWVGGDYVKDCGDDTVVVPPVVHALLYPNPATDRIYLNIPNAKSISFYDMAGKLVQVSDKAEIAAGVYVGGLAGGLYVLRIEADDGRKYIEKLVKL